MSFLTGVVSAVLTALWLMLPAFLANMAPVFVGGGAPIDGGRLWRDGKPILGPGKTWRGLLLAPLLAAFLTWLLRLAAHARPWADYQPWTDWGPDYAWFLIAYALGFGALVGDALKSFFKRRRGIERGQKWPFFDQLDFVVGAIVMSFVASLLVQAFGYPNWWLSAFTWPRVLVLLVLTPGLHLAVNWIGWKLGLKNVPW